MSKGDTFEADFLKLIFNALAMADLAENDASSPLTNLVVSLHTADPTDAGTQLSSEISYGGYARVNVVRTTAGWTVTGSSVSPFADITFAEATSGTGTATFFIVGKATSGAGQILYHGAVTPSIVVTTGVTPRLTTATAITED